MIYVLWREVNNMVSTLLYVAGAVCLLLALLGFLDVLAVPAVTLVVLGAVLLVVAAVVGGRFRGSRL